MQKNSTQIYYFEPDDTKRESTSREMSQAGLEPCEIGADFFLRDLSTMDRDGNATRGFVISETDDTVDFLKKIREAGLRNPIIVLRDMKQSTRNANILNAGADDVMVRPVKGVEIFARINAINRRSHGHVSEFVQIGDIVSYFDGRDPEVNGVRMNLSKREHAIFQHLSLNVNRVISKDTLYESVYAMNDNQPFDKVIDVYICKLRRKIRDLTGASDYIETVYGRGYKLAAPEPKTDAIEGPKAVPQIENHVVEAV